MPIASSFETGNDACAWIDAPLAVLLVEHGGQPERRFGPVGKDERSAVGDPSDRALFVRLDVAAAHLHAGADLSGEEGGHRPVVGEPLLGIGADEQQGRRRST